MKKTVNVHLKNKIYLLNPDKGREEAVRAFVSSRLKSSIVVFIAVILLAILVFINQSSRREEADLLRRGNYGEVSRIISRSFELEGGAEKKIDIEVFSREYSRDEVKEIFNKIKSKLPQVILAENKNLSEIRQRLNLIRGFDDVPAGIYWQSDNDDIVRNDGEVFNKEIGDEGRKVVLDYSIRIGEDISKGSIEIRVLPPIYTEEEAGLESLYHEVKRGESLNRQEEFYKLPDNINGRKVNWYSSNRSLAFPLVILAVILSLLVYYLQEKKLDELLKYRRTQLMRDYYEIANKIILYIEAGVSPKLAFDRLGKEYLEHKRYGRKGSFRYAYEEILIMNREMKSGVSEISAYENCGKRCELIQYKKLFGYVAQSIKKGSHYIVEKLKFELKDAFELRKSTAIRMGEEASTKLMLPMLMMLGIVIAILLIPAFMAFGLS